MTERKNRLVVELDPVKPIIRLRRTLDFPRDLVWRVYTSAEHLPNWWGPAKYAGTVEQWDLRPGGKWRITSSADGKAHHFKGEFTAVKAPELLSWTFGYEDYPAVHETVRFVEENGRTRLEIESCHPDFASREGIIKSGMESGAAEGFDRLEDLLGRLAQ